MSFITGTPGVNIMSKLNVVTFGMMSALVILGGYRTLQTEEQLSNPTPTTPIPTSTPWCMDGNGYPVAKGEWATGRTLKPYNPSFQGEGWQRYECTTK